MTRKDIGLATLVLTVGIVVALCTPTQRADGHLRRRR